MFGSVGWDESLDPGNEKTYPQPGTNEGFLREFLWLFLYGGIWITDLNGGLCQYLITDQIGKFVTHLDFRMTRMFCVCRPANNWKVEELLKTPRQLRLRADLEVFSVED